ncbi:hypothetical protein EV122DRAFT_180589, partial [Schizophyllum commune]
LGQDTMPASMYNNPQLYPKMFPWLFPFGHSGLGSTEVANNKCMCLSAKDQCHHLLMYHDKHFQTDPH